MTSSSPLICVYRSAASRSADHLKTFDCCCLLLSCGEHGNNSFDGCGPLMWIQRCTGSAASSYFPAYSFCSCSNSIYCSFFITLSSRPPQSTTESVCLQAGSHLRSNTTGTINPRVAVANMHHYMASIHLLSISHCQQKYSVAQETASSYSFCS